MVGLVCAAAGFSVADRLSSRRMDSNPASLEAEADRPETDLEGACIASASPAFTDESNDRVPTRSSEPPMTKAPDDLETSPDFEWEHDLGVPTALKLEIEIPTSKSNEILEESTPNSSDSRGSADLLEPDAPVLADDPLDYSLPDPPPGVKSTDPPSELTTSELARIAGRTLNRVDRLGQRVLDGARLTNPSKVPRSENTQYRPEARVAPSWIEGSPGARLEISF